MTPKYMKATPTGYSINGSKFRCSNRTLAEATIETNRILNNL